MYLLAKDVMEWRYQFLHEVFHVHVYLGKKLNSPHRYIKRFSKSGIQIYNSEVPDTAGRKTRGRRRRAQAIAKCYLCVSRQRCDKNRDNFKALCVSRKRQK